MVALCLGLGRRLEFRASLVHLKKKKKKILRLLDPSVGEELPQAVGKLQGRSL